MEFKRKEELYKLEWPKKPKLVDILDLQVPMPKMPPEKEMVNYGKKTKDQKFFRREVPRDILLWDEQKREDYIAAEWHRRLNGYWMLIKGQPFYIPGKADVHFNYWHMQTGTLPQFRMVALRFFQIWDNLIERDDDCFGLIVYKPRRATMTENALSVVWQRSTRYRNFPGGLQHVNEKDVIKSYERIVNANNNMPFFFRPINRGSTNPKEGLVFKIPDERITKKRLREEGIIEIERGLGSKITYESAVTGAYDGDLLGTYYMDEAWKIKEFRLDIFTQWNIVKPCLSYHNDATIFGKGIFTSTVEEVEDGVTLEKAQKFWDDSNINKRNANGRTLSGLYRVFFDYTWAADVDEWGFHKNEEAKRIRDNKIQHAIAERRHDILLNVYRKQPATIEEALSSPPTDCILHPELCEARLHQIKNNLSRYGQPTDRNGNPITKKAVYGELVWVNGVFGGRVEWIPMENGKWCISQQPVRKNFKTLHQGKHFPGNSVIYSMGVDPYDSATLVDEGSDGAFTVKRLYDEGAESIDLEFSEQGEILNPEDMITDQYVCDYRYRHDDPYDFYNDVFKTAVYFGCLAFGERDKPGIITWFKSKGIYHWLQPKPQHLWTARQKKKEVWAKATNELISQYVDLLKAYIPRRVWCCHHERILNDWKFYTDKTRTKRDLAVATGFTELVSVNLPKFEKIEKSDWNEEVFGYHN